MLKRYSTHICLPVWHHHRNWF